MYHQITIGIHERGNGPRLGYPGPNGTCVASLDYLIIDTDLTPSTANIELPNSAESFPSNTCYWKKCHLCHIKL